MSIQKSVLILIASISFVSLFLPAIQVGNTSFPGIAAFAISLGMLFSVDAWGGMFSLASKDTFALHGGIANVLFIIRYVQICRNSINGWPLRVANYLVHSFAVGAIVLSDEITYGKFQIGFYLWIGSHIAYLVFLLWLETATFLKTLKIAHPAKIPARLTRPESESKPIEQFKITP